jgi:fibronectin-binding autotransporter adhesin
MADKKISALTAASTPLAGTEVLPIVQSSSTVKVSVANLTAGRAVTVDSLNITGGSLNLAGGGANGFISGNTWYGINTGNWVFQAGNGTQSFVWTNSSGAAQVTLASNTGNVTLNTGNLIQGTAAKGVNFTANTPAAGMTSQLLNWYEEGTWTPVIRGSGTAGTYQLSVAYGTYTRIGNQVTITGAITLAGAVTGGGTGDLQITGMPFAKAANTGAVGAVYLGNIAFTGNLSISTLTRSASSTLYIVQAATGAGVTQVPVSAAVANGYIDFTFTYNV